MFLDTFMVENLRYYETKVFLLFFAFATAQDFLVFFSYNDKSALFCWLFFRKNKIVNVGNHILNIFGFMLQQKSRRRRYQLIGTANGLWNESLVGFAQVKLKIQNRNVSIGILASVTVVDKFEYVFQKVRHYIEN